VADHERDDTERQDRRDYPADQPNGAVFEELRQEGLSISGILKHSVSHAHLLYTSEKRIPHRYAAYHPPVIQFFREEHLLASV
jgi:hypothetical protein